MRLDPVTAKLFPSIARRLRLLNRLLLFCTHALCFIIGVAITFLFLGYHQRVATDNQTQIIGRVVTLEAQYQRDHPGMHVSKAAAQVIVQRKDDERSTHGVVSQ